MAKGWFVTGTDTGVGKTRAAEVLVSAAADLGRAVGMKPVASGCRATVDGLRSEDAEALMRAANVRAAYVDVNPYAFAPAIAPHLAAEAAGVAIEPETIRTCFARLAAQSDYVIAEGAGGWLTPISATRGMADVAGTLGLPVVLVVGMRLGCLSHALLTQAAIGQSGLPFAGWIANQIDPTFERFDENLATLEQRLTAPLWAVLPYQPQFSLASAKQQLTRVLANSD